MVHFNLALILLTNTLKNSTLSYVCTESVFRFIYDLRLLFNRSLLSIVAKLVILVKSVEIKDLVVDYKL